MRCLKPIWTTLSANISKTFRIKFGLNTVSETSGEAAVRTINSDVTTKLNNVLFQLGNLHTLMSIIFLINTDDDNILRKFNNSFCVAHSVVKNIENFDHDKPDCVNLSPYEASISVFESNEQLFRHVYGLLSTKKQFIYSLCIVSVL